MKRPLKPGDIYPADVLRDEYGMNAANRPTIIVNPGDVPEALRPLIPYVERWAIHCDVTRHDYFDQQPEEDIAQFWHDVLPHEQSIRAWIASQPADVLTWSDAAVHFMYFLKAHSEAYQPTEAQKEVAIAAQAAYRHEQEMKEACAAGLEKFRLKDYAATVALLSPFESELGKVEAAKLSYSRKALSAAKG